MKATRDHGLDAVRAYAMILVVAGHAMVSFTVTPIGWAIQDRSRFLGVDLYAWIVRAFAMPTFFWLAGYFGRALHESAGPGAFLRNRITRLLVPLALLLVPMSLALSWLWDWGREVSTRASVADNIPKLKGSELEIFLGHLWFLYYLVLVSLAAIVVVAIARRVRSAQVPALAVPLVLTTGVLLYLRAMHTDTPLGFVPDVPIFVYMGAFFAWGWLVHARPTELARYQRYAWHSFAAAMLLLAIVIATLYRGLSAIQAPPVHAIVASAGFSVACMVFLIGACARYHREAVRPFLSLASRASYWSYILHLPVAVFFQVALANVPLFGPLKCALIVATTFVICLGSYALVTGALRRWRNQRTVSRISALHR
jgi:peptidoglycan/LPS O-acetylase OafA/YrhL